MSRRWISMVVVVLAVAGVVPTPASAQSLDEARDQREATRAEQAQVAKELDVLHAQESEIRAALEGLDLAVAHQQGKVDAARQALHAAQLTAAENQRRYEATTQEIAVVRARAEGTVVDSYIGGIGSTTDQWLAARDASEASQRQQLLDVVRGRFSDDLEQLRALREDKDRAKRAADEAVAEAARQQEALTAALDELNAQREAQARLEAALRAKIGDYEARKAELQASEDALTAVINQHLAEQAAAQARAAAAPAARAAATPNFAAASAGGFIMPTRGGVSSSFGYRRHPILGSVRLHAGTDFGASYGTPIWAAKDGEVIFAGWNGGYGNCVIIAHGGGTSTLYGHQSQIVVSVGQYVSQGEIIGYVGSTGQSTGPHLHFEVRVGGQPEDPMLFL